MKNSSVSWKIHFRFADLSYLENLAFLQPPLLLTVGSIPFVL